MKCPYDSKTAGKLLKATSGWNAYTGKSGNGEDKFGFSALPSGYGSSSDRFIDVGYEGRWWNTSEYSSFYAYYRRMYYGHAYALYRYDAKFLLQSVRCVQDQ